MLIRRPILDRIKRGEITLAFRRWARPTVKAGGTLKTAVGLLSISSVEKIRERDISEAEARRAGFVTKRELVEELRAREGDVYRIAIAYAGADPRIALRSRAKLSNADFDALRGRLARLDAASKTGPWTLRVLKAIAQHPNLAAVQLAARLRCEKDWLKPNVRKLKNLGLTISHHPGYTLSPRGEAYLARLAPGE